MAEICEVDLQDTEQAMACYEKAVDYYQGEEFNSQAQPCQLKVAQFAANRENYAKAIDIFEQVANRCAKNPMLKSGAKEYFFKAALCHLLVDPLNAEQAMARYTDTFPPVQDTREFKLMTKVLASVQATDVDALSDALANYDQVARLEPWATSMFLRLKRGLGESDLT